MYTTTDYDITYYFMTFVLWLTFLARTAHASVEWVMGC